MIKMKWEKLKNQFGPGKRSGRDRKYRASGGELNHLGINSKEARESMKERRSNRLRKV